MKQYYYLQNSKQAGPVSLDTVKELVNSGVIKRKTQMWVEGLEDWVEADSIDEVKSLFVIPPPIKKSTHEVEDFARELKEKQVKVAKHRNRLILRTVAIVVLAVVGWKVIPLIGEMTESVVEERAPESYINVTGVTHNMNLGLKHVFRGILRNNSSHTTYKNIELRVDWYDKNGNVVASKFHTIGELIAPLQGISFKVKHTSPVSSLKYDIEVVGATPMD